MSDKQKYIDTLRKFAPAHADDIEQIIEPCVTLEEINDAVFRHSEYLGGMSQVISEIVKSEL